MKFRCLDISSNSVKPSEFVGFINEVKNKKERKCENIFNFLIDI